MPANLNLRIVAHHTQSLVNRVLTHRLTRIVIADEDQLSVPIHAFDLFQNSQSLPRQRNKMGSPHL